MTSGNRGSTASDSSLCCLIDVNTGRQITAVKGDYLDGLKTDAQ